MKVKIEDKEFSFDGYVQPFQSIQQLTEKAYQQGKADAFKLVADTFGNGKIIMADRDYFNNWVKEKING